jgi:D-alanyl-D-alanine carboxypeptidase
MLQRSVTVRRGVRLLALAGATLFFSGLNAPVAEARHWRVAHHWHHIRHFQHAYFSQRHYHHAPAESQMSDSGPKAAAVVVDGNSGRTLYALNENELRHPASITKVMTLYLLFEQLEKGHLRLDSEIPISHHASVQAPTKLGLRPGQTIKVEDAIKAIVTRSANDIAVAVAEAVGGDEDSFAEMMTRKAHALGMSRTHYANASGLPNDEQITTAHDLAILGRAVQERFPRYYHYFSTRIFYYAGTVSPNHNHLLDRVEGMDGIKTGYTRASGFNLLTSVKRDGHYIVAVVMGGSSAASRDRTMAHLIEDDIDQGSSTRTAAAITEASEKVAVLDHVEREAESRDDEDAPVQKSETQANQHIAVKAQPAVKAEPVAAQVVPAPVQVAAISTDMPPVRPRPAVVSGVAKPAPVDSSVQPTAAMGRHTAFDGSTTTSLLTTNAIPSRTATPSTMRWVVGPSPAATKDAATKDHAAEPQKTAKAERVAELEKTTTAKAMTEKAATEKAADSGRPSAAHTGWMIQIGATDDIAKANELLARAKSQGHRALSSAQPFTEKVQKGSGTLYRARFAGLEEDSAESACKTLKHSGFSCFATKN